jgi:glycerol-3-phosphate acyltransferase PlsY
MTIVAVTAGYLIGSIPFAFVAARLVKGMDIRRAGSGNVGAANVLRTSGIAMAICVMLLDMGKGAAAVLWLQRLGGGAAEMATAGVAAVMGHIYPIWLRFRGGKGVATAAGAFLVLTPQATIPAAGLFALTVWVTRFVSLGSMIATLAVPPIAFGVGAPTAVIVASAVVAALVVFRHRSNIARLRAGTERRIEQRALSEPQS